MKKNLLLKMQALVAATVITLSAGIQTADAQEETITLKQSDYTVPAWTKLKAGSKNAMGKEQPYAVNMTLNGDPCTRLAFAWFTNEGVVDGDVQIIAKAGAIETDFASAKTVEAKVTPVVGLNYLNSSKNADVIKETGIAANTKRNYTSHKALATGLLPNTTYSYRVGKEGAWSPIGSFTTAKNNKDAFSFIYVTDTQANTDEMFGISQKTIHAALDTVKDAQFLLITGDLVESSGSSNSEWEWEQWFSCMQDVWHDMPIAPAQGNHDTSTNNNFFQHFNTDTTFNQSTANGTAMNGTVYSFVYGDALFMVINYEDYKKSGYFDTLAQWMEKQVNANKDVKWRIACYHKNMFTGSKSHQSDSDGKLVREAMLPVFDKLKIDLALQGHDHIYEVMGPVRNADKTLIKEGVQHVEIVSNGNQRENMTGKAGGVFNVKEGTLYFLNNSAGKKKYEPRNEDEMIAALPDHAVNNYWGLFSGKFGQTGEATFSRVNVSSDEISIKTYTVNDLGQASLFDSFSVVKDNTTTSTSVLKSEQVQVYPNPASDMVSISGVTAEKIELFSAKGDLVQTVKNSNKFNVSSLSAGIYFARIIAADDVYFSKVIVK